MYKVIGLILTLFFVQNVMAETPCPKAKRERLKIHALYSDDGVMMCAVEATDIFWWKQSKRYKQKSQRDVWYSCNDFQYDIRRGDPVDGVLKYVYRVDGENCDERDGDKCDYLPKFNCIAVFDRT